MKTFLLPLILLVSLVVFEEPRKQNLYQRANDDTGISETIR